MDQPTDALDLEAKPVPTEDSGDHSPDQSENQDSSPKPTESSQEEIVEGDGNDHPNESSNSTEAEDHSSKE